MARNVAGVGSMVFCMEQQEILSFMKVYLSKTELVVVSGCSKKLASQLKRDRLIRDVLLLINFRNARPRIVAVLNQMFGPESESLFPRAPQEQR